VAYDETLADRVRAALLDQTGVTERRMFGGLAFMLDGHMCCGIVGRDLMLRLGERAAKEALGKPHVRPMDFTGKPAKGAVYVAPEGLAGEALGDWVARAVGYVRGLPHKP
jgi:TfoX/Sxy family transcriptional regulator of competence genes